MAKAKPPDRHQQRTHRAWREAESYVQLGLQGPAMRRPELLQGERAEATWQALPARMSHAVQSFFD